MPFSFSTSTNTALQVTRIYNVPGHGGEWDASPVTGNLSDLSWPSGHHISATVKYSKRPTDLRSGITYGIRFGGGNIRWCSVCKIEFYGRYSILPHFFWGWPAWTVSGRDCSYCLRIPYIHGYLSPPSWRGHFSSPADGNLSQYSVDVGQYKEEFTHHC